MQKQKLQLKPLQIDGFRTDLKAEEQIKLKGGITVSAGCTRIVHCRV